MNSEIFSREAAFHLQESFEDSEGSMLKGYKKVMHGMKEAKKASKDAAKTMDERRRVIRYAN